MKRFASILAALALVATIAGPAMAADSQSVTESLKVASSFAVTGIPDSVSYGTVTRDAENFADQVIAITITGDYDWAMHLSGSDLVDTRNPANRIGKAERLGVLSDPTGPVTLDITRATFDAHDTGGGSFGDANTVAAHGTDGVSTLNLALSVFVPAVLPAGTYTGFITIAVK